MSLKTRLEFGILSLKKKKKIMRILRKLYKEHKFITIKRKKQD